MSAKIKVKKLYPTAIARRPNPRGLYYDEWTVAVPPTSIGMFGPMAQILGHGMSAIKAWASAAESLPFNLPKKKARK